MNNRLVNIYLILCIVVSLIFVISLYHRVPNEDEAIIGEHALSLAENGYVKSAMYSRHDINLNEINELHYHKLFVVLGAFIVKLAGFNLYWLKLISLLALAALFIFLYKYSKSETPNYYHIFLIIFPILLFNHLIFLHSYMYRPETTVIAFGFMSFFFLVKFLKTEKIFYAGLAGFLAGLALLSHLNGLVFIIAGLGLLIFRKKWKYIFIFGIISGITSLLYFYDLTNVETFKQWVYQMQSEPNLLHKLPPVANLLAEQRRFFWNPFQIIFTLLFFTSLYIYIKYSKNRDNNVLIYLLLLVITLGIFGHGKTIKYFTYYLPFMVLIIGEVVYNLNSNKKAFSYLTYSFLVLYFIVHGFYNFRVIQQRLDIVKRNEEIVSYIPEKNIRISGPSVMVFNQIKKFHVRGYIAFDPFYLAYHQDVKYSTENYFKYALLDNCKYLIIDKYSNGEPLYPDIDNRNLKEGDLIWGYSLFKKEDDFYLFKAINN